MLPPVPLLVAVTHSRTVLINKRENYDLRTDP